AEAQRSGGERAALRAGVERGEAVAAQDRQAGAAAGVAGSALARRSGPATVVEPQLVPHDEAAAACRLHVTPVPVALVLGHREERPALRPVPVEAVAAEADADLVRLRPARRDVLVAAPDGEQAQHQALVC